MSGFEICKGLVSLLALPLALALVSTLASNLLKLRKCIRKYKKKRSLKISTDMNDVKKDDIGGILNFIFID